MMARRREGSEVGKVREGMVGAKGEQGREHA